MSSCGDLQHHCIIKVYVVVIELKLNSVVKGLQFLSVVERCCGYTVISAHYSLESDFCSIEDSWRLGVFNISNLSARL